MAGVRSLCSVPEGKAAWLVVLFFEVCDVLDALPHAVRLRVAEVLKVGLVLLELSPELQAITVADLKVPLRSFSNALTSPSIHGFSLGKVVVTQLMPQKRRRICVTLCVRVLRVKPVAWRRRPQPTHNANHTKAEINVYAWNISLDLL